MKTRAALLLALLTAAAHAGPRTSTSYTVVTDTTDGGGKRATSAAYTNDGSANGIGGVSSVAAPAETAKSGYIGQLYDVTGLTLTAATLTVNEGATDQLSAWQVLDDLSLLAVPAASPVWSVQNGPLAINAGGLVTAGAVFRDTSATAQGTYAGFTGTLGLTVVNTLADNFGLYAADGIDDGWQVQYFGESNPSAGPAADPDGDTQDNLFEFRAGVIPTDGESHFRFRLEPVAGQPSQHRIIFSLRLDGRNYTVLKSPTLLPDSWTSLTDGLVSDNSDERTVTDPDGGDARAFYRIQITRP